MHKMDELNQIKRREEVSYRGDQGGQGIGRMQNGRKGVPLCEALSLLPVLCSLMYCK